MCIGQSRTGEPKSGDRDVVLAGRSKKARCRVLRIKSNKMSCMSGKSAAAWWLKDMIKSGCPQVLSTSARSQGCCELCLAQERCLSAGGEVCQAKSDGSRREKQS